MHDENEIKKMKLDLLNLRLSELEAERIRIQQEVRSIRSSLNQDKPKGLLNRTTVAAASLFAVSALVSIGVYHDAQSSVKNSNPTHNAFISSLANSANLRSKHSTASINRQPARISTSVTRNATEHQWGPSLQMPESVVKKHYYGFDPVVKQQQQNLMTLGFELDKADGFKGPGTQRAFTEFRSLYLPDNGEQLKDADLAVIMESYATMARNDADRYGVDHGVVAAIRLSSIRTGVDFSYLMKLAATESNFEPAIEAATSSATGLYQFTRDTWLKTVKSHGEKYGIVADYAANIEYVTTRSGYQRPVVSDEALYQHLLELRKNPRIASMMAAETVRDHQQQLQQSLDREPTETDLYLAHFLGIDNAVTFLQSLKQQPGTHAVELFPMAANSNYDIFHPSTCEPRTVDEVYALFDKKFSRNRYDDLAAN